MGSLLKTTCMLFSVSPQSLKFPFHFRFLHICGKYISVSDYIAWTIGPCSFQVCPDCVGEAEIVVPTGACGNVTGRVEAYIYVYKYLYIYILEMCDK